MATLGGAKGKVGRHLERSHMHVQNAFYNCIDYNNCV